MVDLDLVSILEELRSRYGSSPSYQVVWQAAAAGRIPARRDGRYWRARREDVPEIARVFGLDGPSTDRAA